VPFDDKYSGDNAQNAPKDVLSQVKEDVEDYMAWLAASSTLLFLALIIYFPDKPKLPPSNSGAVEKADFSKVNLLPY